MLEDREQPGDAHRVEPKSRTQSRPDSDLDGPHIPYLGAHVKASAQNPQTASYVLRGGSYKFAMLVLFVFMTLVALIPTLQKGPISGHVFYGAFVLVFVVFDVRWLRAQVSITPSGLRLRNLFRTYHLRWDEVCGAEVASSNANNLVSLVQVQTASGRSIKVDGVGEWGKPESATRVRDAVDLIDEYSQGQLPSR